MTSLQVIRVVFSVKVLVSVWVSLFENRLIHVSLSSKWHHSVVSLETMLLKLVS